MLTTEQIDELSKIVLPLLLEHVKECGHTTNVATLNAYLSTRLPEGFTHEQRMASAVLARDMLFSMDHDDTFNEILATVIHERCDKYISFIEYIVQHTENFDDLCDCPYSEEPDYGSHREGCRTMSFRKECQNVFKVDE